MENVSVKKMITTPNLESKSDKVISLEDRVFLKYKDKKKNSSIENMSFNVATFKLLCNDVNMHVMINNKINHESMSSHLTELFKDKQTLSDLQPVELIRIDVLSSGQLKQPLRKDQVVNTNFLNQDVNETDFLRSGKEFYHRNTTRPDTSIKHLATFQREMISEQSMLLDNNDLIPAAEHSYELKKENKSDNNVIANVILPHTVNERDPIAKIMVNKQAMPSAQLLPEEKVTIDPAAKSSEPITYNFQKIPGEHSVKIHPLTQVQLSLQPSSILVQNLLQQQKGYSDTSAEWLLSADSILEDENESDNPQ